MKNIFNFVTNHLEYFRFDEQNRGAKKALKQGAGDCTEYSELMIALCRANNIPARIVSGKTLTTLVQNVELHDWVEVYFEKYGWIPFDPTHADGKNRKTTFQKLENKYIYLSNERFIYQTQWKFRKKEMGTHILNFERNWQDLSLPLMKEAVAIYNSENFHEAEERFKLLVKLSESYYRPYCFLGILYARQGKFEKALSQLQKAVRRAYFKDEKVDAIYAFANYYALNNEPKKAISHLKKALEMGMRAPTTIMNDKDLYSLWKEKEFKEILSILRKS